MSRTATAPGRAGELGRTGHLTTAARPPKRRRALRRILFAFAALLAVLLGYVGVTFFQVWSAANSDDRSPASAIVVLGAAQYDGRPSPALQHRLDHAVELYRQGVAKVVVVSGGKQTGDRTTEGKVGYDYLRSKGIPDSAIRVEVGGTDTFEELSATALIVHNAKLGKDVVVVTDPYHAYRSAAIAGEVGLDAHVSPTGAETSFAALGRETLAVAAGRIIGFRRLSNAL